MRGTHGRGSLQREGQWEHMRFEEGFNVVRVSLSVQLRASAPTVLRALAPTVLRALAPTVLRREVGTVKTS